MQLWMKGNVTLETTLPAYAVQIPLPALLPGFSTIVSTIY